MDKKFRITRAAAGAGLTLAVVLAGCSQDGPSGSAEANARTPIAMMAADFGRVVKDDNPVVEQLGARTGTTITTTIVPASEYIQKMNILFASDTLPDIVRFQGYDHFQYIPSGSLLELGQYLDKYPNLKNSMPPEAWELLKVNGNIYTIPNYNVPGKYSYYMRGDWLEKLGLQRPANLDELREVLHAFTYNDPDGNGHNDTWGLAGDDTLVSVRTSAFMPIFGAFGFQPGAFFERDGKAFNPLLTDEYKQALEYVRMLYMDDKVIDPDLFIIQGDQAKQNIVNSKVGSVKGWWALVCETLYDQMKMDVVSPEAEWIVVNDIKGPNGDYGMVGNDLNGWTTSISSNSKNIEKALELLDYMATDEGFMLSSYGIEGEHYTVDASGEYEDRTEQGKQAMNEKWLDIMSQFVYRVTDYQKLLVKSNPSYGPYLEAARDSKLYMNMFEGISTDESQKYNADLDKISLEWMVKFVTGKEPLSEFDKYVAEYKAKGGDAVLQSYIQEYNSRKGTALTAGN